MEHCCKSCGETKDVREFRKNYREGPYEPWNLRVCKKCVHKEYLERYADEERRKSLNGSSSKWKRNNPERHAELNQEYRKKYPEKIVAHNRLGYAVRSGKVKKLPCEVCGTTERVHGHHISYKPEDWYNVRWLCFRCHKFEHAPPEYLSNSG